MLEGGRGGKQLCTLEREGDNRSVQHIDKKKKTCIFCKWETYLCLSITCATADFTSQLCLTCDRSFKV